MSFQALRDTLLKTLEAFEDSSFLLITLNKILAKWVEFNLFCLNDRYSVKELCDFKELVKEDKIKNNAKTEVRDALKKEF